MLNKKGDDDGKYGSYLLKLQNLRLIWANLLILKLLININYWNVMYGLNELFMIPTIQLLNRFLKLIIICLDISPHIVQQQKLISWCLFMMLHPLLDFLHLPLQSTHLLPNLQLEHPSHLIIIYVILLFLISRFSRNRRNILWRLTLLCLYSLLRYFQLVTLLLRSLSRRYLRHEQVVLQGYPRIVYYPRCSQGFASSELRRLVYLQVTHCFVMIQVGLFDCFTFLEICRVIHYSCSNLESIIVIRVE